MKWKLCCDLMLIGIFDSAVNFDIFYVLIKDKLGEEYRNFLLKEDEDIFLNYINENGINLKIYQDKLVKIKKEYNIKYLKPEFRIGKEFADKLFISKNSSIIKYEKISVNWLKKRICYSGKTDIIGIDSFLPYDFRVGFRRARKAYYSYLTATLDDIFYFFVKGQLLYKPYEEERKKSPGYKYKLDSSDSESQIKEKIDSITIFNFISNFKTSYILIQIFMEKFLKDIGSYYVDRELKNERKINKVMIKVNKFLKQGKKLSVVDEKKIFDFIDNRDFRNTLMHNSTENLDIHINEWEEKANTRLIESLEVCKIYSDAFGFKYTSELFRNFNYDDWMDRGNDRIQGELNYIDSHYKLEEK